MFGRIDFIQTNIGEENPTLLTKAYINTFIISHVNMRERKMMRTD